MNIVLDASVAVKCFFPEQHSAQAQSVVVGTDDLHAPEVLLLEFDSVLCRRVRRGESSLTDAEDARSRLRLIPVSLHRNQALLDEAFAAAARTGCTPYDCLYVALAARLGGKMVTADQKLCRNLQNGPLSQYVLWIGNV